MNRQRESRSQGRELAKTSQIAHAHSGTPQTVPLETRAQLEPLFHHRFGDVRIYSDDRAGSVAESLHAKAFTVGQDIAFAPGRYDPHTPHGQRPVQYPLPSTTEDV